MTATTSSSSSFGAAMPRDTLLAIADPVAARAAVAAGVGATIRVTLGGAFMPAFYTPVEVEATVTAVRSGAYRLELPVRPVDIGATAVLRGRRDVDRRQRRKALQLDESVFHMAGLEPRSARHGPRQIGRRLPWRLRGVRRGHHRDRYAGAVRQRPDAAPLSPHPATDVAMGRGPRRAVAGSRDGPGGRRLGSAVASAE